MFKKFRENILIEVKRLMNELLIKLNGSFEKIKRNEDMLRTYIRATQSGLDKFKKEIGNNGVFNRLKALEDDKYEWNKVLGEAKKSFDYSFYSFYSKPAKKPTLFERIEAIEKFLNVEYKVEESEKTEGYVVKKPVKKSKKVPF